MPDSPRDRMVIENSGDAPGEMRPLGGNNPSHSPPLSLRADANGCKKHMHGAVRYGAAVPAESGMKISIAVVSENKKDFLDLLLLGDEQEDMIDRYLERGELFVLSERGGRAAICVCVVTDEGNGLFEIKNLATDARYQGLGYGSLMVRHVCAQYMGKGTDMLVGTGESPRTLNFYRRCGFSYSHRLKDFFINNYRHPIVEDGVVLTDMIYLKKAL